VTASVTNGTKNPKRKEIQALRALAIALVFLYHLWPNKLTGGFVGVDVFFVISGFLITSHLIAAATSAGGLKLSTFYVRRIRRLLPASLLVLISVIAVTIVAAPQTLWQSTFANTFSSAFYYQNWALAAGSVDYLGASNDTNPVQHFWSLSVEEQFYLVWPLLILGSVGLARRIRSDRGLDRSFIFATLCIVWVGSFVVSVLWTSSDQAFAYFATPTRAWEFAAGGLLAFLPAAIAQSRPRWSALFSWVGLAAIVYAAVTYTGDTLFPGWTAAVPVLGTCLIIAAGSPSSRLSPSGVYSIRPVQWVGDISYSVYLVHWPLIVLLPVVIDRNLTLNDKLVVVVVALALGWCSKRFVEDRFVTSSAVDRISGRARTTRTLIGAVSAMALIAAVSVPMSVYSNAQVANAQSELQHALSDLPACFGAQSIADADCSPRVEGVVPSPLIARTDVAQQDCQQSASTAEVLECKFGLDGGTPVALVGDSHTTQWLPVIEALAVKHGWSITTYLRSGCSLGAGGPTGISSAGKCNQWGENVLERMSSSDFKYVFVSSRNYWVGSTSSVEARDRATQLSAAWIELEQSGAQIVAIRDTPQPVLADMSDPATCVLDDMTGKTCDFAESAAVGQVDPLELATEIAGEAVMIDMTPYFCVSGRCPAVIGGVLVYRDANHMTATFSRTLAPFFETEMQIAFE
jgi:peptidoglycan/LPS O-acetylase OafA/YrhL